MEHADGSWWAQVMAPVELQGGCEEGAFFHFQTWKRQYKTLAYGSPELPGLRYDRLRPLARQTWLITSSNITNPLNGTLS